MNGYEAMAIMALVLDEATEKAIRDPQFTRYAFDLGDLARQMRYTARMTQEYLKALDVDCKDELEADMAAAEVIELTHIARTPSCIRMNLTSRLPFRRRSRPRQRTSPYSPAFSALDTRFPAS